jgi:hypothetical protein
MTRLWEDSMRLAFAAALAALTAVPAAAHHGWGRHDAAVGEIGRTVAAYGYPSTVERDEMRAERITADGQSNGLR